MPGAKAIRAPSRVGLVLSIAEAVGLAAFFAQARNRGGRAALFAWGFLAVSVFEQGHWARTFDKIDVREEVAILSQSIAPTCEYFFYSPRIRSDDPRPEYQFELDAMWVAVERGIPTLNGYSGNTPPGWALAPATVHGPDDEIRLGTALHRWLGLQPLRASSICWIQDEPPDQ